MKTTRSILALAVGAALSASASAGTFIFAESQENPDIIVHPIGYTGAGGTLSISVCIATTSESQSDLEIPVRNAINTWNTFQPSKSNVTRGDPQLDNNEFDIESVLLHEVGHCIGLAHPNLANESNLPDPDDWDYAKTLKTGGSYDLGIGGDGVRGSRDDQRGDDVNLNWFRIGSNDPFLFESEIDLDTYSNDVADLPGGHAFVEIASYDVSQLRGEGAGEGVMNQLTLNQETQRQIHNEDATTLRIGRSGADEDQGTADDYDIELVYGGISDSCDITVEMTGGGFGVCNVSATSAGLPANHLRITTGTITLGSTGSVNWFFNDTLSGGGIFHDRFEQ
ncbi:hypothetical protein G4Y73_01980 [Wenzhouxiangella sp. XN201]|uniref:hypothetical protein n=1 Tax=Wenzhouxiangella sp. XN201 TaxID=2710755 RepID=UPI0013C91D22|nr:hypothetical protein [Wenzhouxiangella sp. XN201]NEZ02915.1 hypothetical protein [Wenzhouxiangella sp. XN201]